MNADISVKDKRITKLYNEVNTLMDKGNGLSVQLAKAKSIVMDTY